MMITYVAFDEWKPIAFAHQGLAYVRYGKSCLDHFLRDAQIGSRVPRLGDIEDLNGWP